MSASGFMRLHLLWFAGINCKFEVSFCKVAPVTRLMVINFFGNLCLGRHLFAWLVTGVIQPAPVSLSDLKIPACTDTEAVLSDIERAKRGALLATASQHRDSDSGTSVSRFEVMPVCFCLSRVRRAVAIGHASKSNAASVK